MDFKYLWADWCHHPDFPQENCYYYLYGEQKNCKYYEAGEYYNKDKLLGVKK